MSRKILLLAVSLACLTVTLLYISPRDLPAQSQTQFLPARPIAHSTSTPVFPSNAHKALSHVSQTMRLPIERLMLADSFVRELPLSRHSLWRGWVLDRKERLLYEVIVDVDTGKIVNSQEMELLWKAEQATYRARYSQQVLERVAQQASTPVANLRITNDILESYPLTQRVFWQVKVLDIKTMEPHRLALGPDGVEVDPATLQKAEFEARRTRYGRLDPELYYRLQVVGANESVPVLIWVRGVDYKWIDTQLAQYYPDLVAEHHFVGGHIINDDGSLAHLQPELLERVWADYNNLLDQTHLAAAQPVLDFLSTMGYKAQPFKSFPGVYAELPGSAISELNKALLENLGTIYWGTIEFQPALDSVAPTIRAPDVWNSDLCNWHGCTGAGITVGILDVGIIEPNVTHSALQGKIVAANAVEATNWHAAAVAGVIAGNHPDFPQYRGIAYGSNSLVSAKAFNNWPSLEAALNWLVDQGAFAINASIETTGTLNMHPEDRAFDYLVRMRDPTIAIVAGNNRGDVWGANIKSPSHAYNVITVGAFDDHNTPDWTGDSMPDWSCYVNPYIDGQDTAGDREKPEVVAVGADVTTVFFNDPDDNPNHPCHGQAFCSRSGTSFATPQVTALAALLMERYYYLRANPEAIQAIIMASAINDIDDEPAPLGDKDGAGGIDVASALSVFRDGGWDYNVIQNITAPNDLTNPFKNPGACYEFSHAAFEIGSTDAAVGERVRAAIAWDSNPNVDFTTDGSDPLSTDFDLYIKAPSGANVVEAISTSSNNNYEIVEFSAPETGEYKIRVCYFPRGSISESANLGLGLAWVRFRHRVYLPVILKNYPPPAPFATIVLDAPQPDGDNGWYVSDVEVSFTVPSTMPLPSIEYRLNLGNWQPFTMPFTITTEGENLVQIRPAELVNGPFGMLAHRMRLAGVTDEEILPFILKIDKSLPTLAITMPQSITYTHGVTFALDYQAADAYSGSAVITATLDTQPVTNGQVIDTLTLGHGFHEFILAARDMAGHTASQSVVFTVTATISGLIDLKHRLYAEGGIYGPGAHGIVQSLDAKLEAAQRNVEAGQYQAAINDLQAFIHEVEAQTDKHITPDAAQLLIGDAQRVSLLLSPRNKPLLESARGRCSDK